MTCGTPHACFCVPNFDLSWCSWACLGVSAFSPSTSRITGNSFTPPEQSGDNKVLKTHCASLVAACFFNQIFQVNQVMPGWYFWNNPGNNSLQQESEGRWSTASDKEVDYSNHSPTITALGLQCSTTNFTISVFENASHPEAKTRERDMTWQRDQIPTQSRMTIC